MKGLKMRSVSIILSSIFLAFGIIVSGYFVAMTKMSDRYVTVKGVAEQDVEADLAVWPIKFTVTGNDLVKMQTEIEKNFAIISAFIKSKNINDTLFLTKPEMTDLMAQSYNSQEKVHNRFIITQPVMLRTTNVDAVAQLAGSIGELTKQGIIMNDYSGPKYIYTKLNDIKPSMIAEATKNARKGAEQFAADSNSAIAGIRRANQGVFTILPRDGGEAYEETSTPNKKIRVVSTIEYILGDE